MNKKIIPVALLVAFAIVAVVVVCLLLPGNNAPAADFSAPVEYLNAAMGDIGNKTTESFNVLSDITIGGTAHYKVEWTSDNADVTIAADAATAGTMKVSLPARATADVTYTLTAVISDDNGNKAEALKYTLTIPAMPKLPDANSNVTIKNALEIGLAHAHNTYTQNKYYITGEIDEIVNEQYGNMYIKDREGNRLYLYGTYVAGIPFGDLDKKPAVGDTIKVYGAIGQYNDAAQIKNSTIVEVNGKAPEVPAGSVLTVVDAPKTNTAYKFGMVQPNAGGGTYYLVGGMNGYYLATTTKAADALDVYLEKTEGGYYLYCKIGGEKTYINMVVSGSHVNGAYEATATTVYTYDANSKTLKAPVNGEDYWFGTRNDKSYTTVGPCAVRYEGFYCQFYK